MFSLFKILFPELGIIRVILSHEWIIYCLIKYLTPAVLGLMMFSLHEMALGFISRLFLNWFCCKLWEGLKGLLIVWEKGFSGC